MGRLLTCCARTCQVVVRTIVGVRKIRSSCFDTFSVLFLNNHPKTGIRDRYGDARDVVRLGIHKDSADHHRLPVTDQHLGGRFTTIDARTGWVARAPTAFLVARTFMRICLPISFGSRGGDLGRHIQLKIGVHEGRLCTLKRRRLEEWIHPARSWHPAYPTS